MISTVRQHIRIFILLALAALFCTSCGKFSFSVRGNRTIIPNVVSGGELKSAPTKGAAVTKDNIASFKMKAYAEGEWHDNTLESGEVGSLSNPHPAGEYFSGTQVTKNGSAWEMAATRYWQNDVPLSFWSWNSLEPSVDPDEAGDYDKARFSLTVASQASSQPDLIFAYNGEKRTFDKDGKITSGTGTYSTEAKDAVNIHFYHALSAIRFDISGVASGHTVDKRELSGIYIDGICDIDASSGTPSLNWHDRTTTGTVYENYTSSDFTSEGKYLAGTEKEFMMIPQALTTASEITVYFDGSTTGVTKPLDASTIWKEGKYYGYKISYNGSVMEIILDAVMNIDSWGEDIDQNLDL